MSLPTDGNVVACDVTDEFMKKVQSQHYFKEVFKQFIGKCLLNKNERRFFLQVLNPIDENLLSLRQTRRKVTKSCQEWEFSAFSFLQLSSTMAKHQVQASGPSIRAKHQVQASGPSIRAKHQGQMRKNSWFLSRKSWAGSNSTRAHKSLWEFPRTHEFQAKQEKSSNRRFIKIVNSPSRLALAVYTVKTRGEAECLYTW